MVWLVEDFEVPASSVSEAICELKLTGQRLLH
jgi:hypothetical protein